MTSWTPPNEELSPLLQAFDLGLKQHGRALRLLSLRVFLLCAERPRTMAELEVATGLDKGRLNRVTKLIAPWRDEQTGVTRKPEMHLLQRRSVMFVRGHRFRLTREGRKLLEGTWQ